MPMPAPPTAQATNANQPGNHGCDTKPKQTRLAATSQNPVRSVASLDQLHSGGQAWSGRAVQHRLEWQVAGQSGGLAAGADVQLVEDVADVELDRVLTELQIFGDLPVAQALGDT